MRARRPRYQDGNLSADPDPVVPDDDGDPPQQFASRLRHLALWNFHGDDDPVFPVSEAREGMAAFNATGSRARYTELAGFAMMSGTSPTIHLRSRSGCSPSPAKANRDVRSASSLAVTTGFDVTVGDLLRYKARATTWQLSDEELEVVASWQPQDQPYWWQHIWRDDPSREPDLGA